MTKLINDVRENVRRFNQEEAVWQCYEAKRRKLRRLRPRSKSLKELLDRLAWSAAEREMQRSDCIGKTSP